MLLHLYLKLVLHLIKMNGKIHTNKILLFYLEQWWIASKKHYDKLGEKSNKGKSSIFYYL